MVFGFWELSKSYVVCRLRDLLDAIVCSLVFALIGCYMFVVYSLLALEFDCLLAVFLCQAVNPSSHHSSFLVLYPALCHFLYASILCLVICSCLGSCLRSIRDYLLQSLLLGFALLFWPVFTVLLFGLLLFPSALLLYICSFGICNQLRFLLSWYSWFCCDDTWFIPLLYHCIVAL